MLNVPSLIIGLLLISQLALAQIGNLTVTSGASFEPGLPPKGSIATIFLTGLEGIHGVIAASTIPLPRELAGVRVRVGGAEAPIFALAAGNGFQQINIQVPQEANIREDVNWPVGPTESRTEVEVEQKGARATVPVLVRKSPGDFFLWGDNLAIFQHASDYSLVTRENPARPNEVIIAYLTGMRATVPIVPTGQPSPSDPPATFPPPPPFQQEGYSIILVTPQLGNQFGTILFAGLAPGLIGVHQINFRIPADYFAFGTVPPTPFMAELLLSRSRCLFPPCNTFSTSVFGSSRVRIPIAPQ